MNWESFFLCALLVLGCVVLCVWIVRVIDRGICACWYWFGYGVCLFVGLI